MTKHTSEAFLVQAKHYGVPKEIADQILNSSRYNANTAHALFGKISTIQQLHQVLKEVPPVLQAQKPYYYAEFLLTSDPESNPVKGFQYLFNNEPKEIVDEAIALYENPKAMRMQPIGESEVIFLNKLVEYGVAKHVGEDMLQAPNYNSRNAGALFCSFATVQQLHQVLKAAPPRIQQDKIQYYVDFLFNANPDPSPEAAIRYLKRHEEKGVGEAVRKTMQQIISFYQQKQTFQNIVEEKNNDIEEARNEGPKKPSGS